MEELVELLEKFKTVEVQRSSCATDLDRCVVCMAISDTKALRAILNVFLHGGWDWDCQLGIKHTGSREDICLICDLQLSKFGTDKADLKRELDYKKCLLRSALGSTDLLK